MHTDILIGVYFWCSIEISYVETMRIWCQENEITWKIEEALEVSIWDHGVPQRTTGI